jgi:hypothetical protein
MSMSSFYHTSEPFDCAANVHVAAAGTEKMTLPGSAVHAQRFLPALPSWVVPRAVAHQSSACREPESREGMRRVARGRRTRGEDRRTSLIAAIRVDLGRTIPIQRPTQTQGGRYFSVQLGGATGDGHAVHASSGSSPRIKRARDVFQLPREKVQSASAWTRGRRRRGLTPRRAQAASRRSYEVPGGATFWPISVIILRNPNLCK